MTSRTVLLSVVLLLVAAGFLALDGGKSSPGLAGAVGVGSPSSADFTSGSAPGDLAPIRPVPWPPALGQRYPDLALLDRDGREVSLSRWRGDVLLIEPVGMTCPACQGFSGGNEVGSFGGMAVQKGAVSIERLLDSYGDGVGLRDVVFVQLLLYDLKMGPPGPEDAAAWDEHFGISRRGGRVLVPAGDLRQQATYDLIPGFQVVDRDFVLRWDASGHRPTHGYDELLGGIRSLL